MRIERARAFCYNRDMLTRAKHKMPIFVKDALESAELFDVYKSRPAYQQNDYIGWITSAKQAVTKEKRLQQMLAELKKGGVYMNMSHPPSARKKHQ